MIFRWLNTSFPKCGHWTMLLYSNSFSSPRITRSFKNFLRFVLAQAWKRKTASPADVVFGERFRKGEARSGRKNEREKGSPGTETGNGSEKSRRSPRRANLPQKITHGKQLGKKFFQLRVSRTRGGGSRPTPLRRSIEIASKCFQPYFNCCCAASFRPLVVCFIFVASVYSFFRLKLRFLHPFLPVLVAYEQTNALREPCVEYYYSLVDLYTLLAVHRRACIYGDNDFDTIQCSIPFTSEVMGDLIKCLIGK